MQTSFPFFASATEQLNWLRAVLATSGVWCVVENIRQRSEARELPANQVLDLLVRQNDGGLRVFLGRVDLSVTEWRETPHGRMLDVIRSRAVQFIPCYVAGEALIEGRFDILRKADYELAELEFKPLSRWFAELAASLKLVLNAKPVAVGTRTGTGELVHSPGKVLLSQEAIEWRKGGGHWKQLPESPIEIDVMHSVG